MPRPYDGNTMSKTISEKNLRTLVDALLAQNKRVVGPKGAGSMPSTRP